VAARAAADDAPAPATPLAFGTRVRVHTARQGRIVAYLAEQRPDALVVDRRRDGGVERLTLVRSEIRSLEVSGRESRRGKGAMVGLILGIVGGAFAGLLTGDEGCGVASLPNTIDNFSANLSSSLCVSKADGALAGALVGGAAGAGLGALAARGEEWRPVPLARLSMGATRPRGGGAAVRLSVSF